MKSQAFLVAAALIFASLAAVAEGQQAPAKTVAPAPDDAKMKAFVDTNCTACHDASTFTKSPHTHADWPEIVQRMTTYQPSLADADQKALVAYLAKTYSPKSN